MRFLWIVALLCASLLIVVDGERILVVIPVSLYSHNRIFTPICLALARRGHDMVVITMQRLDVNQTNYRQIDMTYLKEKIDKLPYSVWRSTFWEENVNPILLKLHYKFAENVYQHPEVKQLYAKDSNETFDAVIVDGVLDISFHAFAHRFNAPLIGLFTLEPSILSHYLSGNPILPSHISNQNLKTAGINLSFWQRIKNFVTVWYSVYCWFHYAYPKSHKIVTKYFGDDMPYITDITKNMSLQLVNAAPGLMIAKPENRNIVYFHGLHIGKNDSVLPSDLQLHLDNAIEGFIYVSFGSSVKGVLLPREKLEIMANVFSKLPYKVIWKLEDEIFPELPKNVIVSPWFPQHAVLAHPNIKLFIYQGGFQSTEEAVYYSVPLVGIPIAFDQGFQIKKLVLLGVAVEVDIDNITEEILRNAVYRVLQDKRYKERMAKLSALIHDVPYNAMDNVIWWIEHVMRNKGLSYLRSSIIDEPWYQRYDTDVIAFLAVTIFTVAVISFIAVLSGIVLIFKRYSSSFAKYRHLLRTEKAKIN